MRNQIYLLAGLVILFSNITFYNVGKKILASEQAHNCSIVTDAQAERYNRVFTQNNFEVWNPNTDTKFHEWLTRNNYWFNKENKKFTVDSAIIYTKEVLYTMEIMPSSGREWLHHNPKKFPSELQGDIRIIALKDFLHDENEAHLKFQVLSGLEPFLYNYRLVLFHKAR